MRSGRIVLTIYLDSSALVKLAVREAETLALTTALAQAQDFAVSRIAEVEVLRAVFFAGGDSTVARAVLDRCAIIELTRAVTQDAATLPGRLRSLDAIHLATARQLRSDLEYLISYDRRMLDAAQAIGIRTREPRGTV